VTTASIYELLRYPIDCYLGKAGKQIATTYSFSNISAKNYQKSADVCQSYSTPSQCTTTTTTTATTTSYHHHNHYFTTIITHDNLSASHDKHTKSEKSANISSDSELISDHCYHFMFFAQFIT